MPGDEGGKVSVDPDGGLTLDLSSGPQPDQFGRTFHRFARQCLRLGERIIEAELAARSIDPLPDGYSALIDDSAKRKLTSVSPAVRSQWPRVWEFLRTHDASWLADLAPMKDLRGIRAAVGAGARRTEFADWRGLTVRPKGAVSLAVHALARGWVQAHWLSDDHRSAEAVDMDFWSNLDGKALRAADADFERNGDHARTDELLASIFGGKVAVLSRLEAVEHHGLLIPPGPLAEAYRGFVLMDIDVCAALHSAEVMRGGILRQFGTWENSGTDDFDGAFTLPFVHPELVQAVRCPSGTLPDIPLPVDHRAFESYMRGGKTWFDGRGWGRELAHAHSALFRAIASGQVAVTARPAGTAARSRLEPSTLFEQGVAYNPGRNELRSADGFTWHGLEVISDGGASPMIAPRRKQSAKSKGALTNTELGILAVFIESKLVNSDFSNVKSISFKGYERAFYGSEGAFPRTATNAASSSSYYAFRKRLSEMDQQAIDAALASYKLFAAAARNPGWPS